MTHQAKIIIGFAVLVIIVYAALALDLPYRNKIDDFATCVAAGNSVMESYPRQCRDKKGNTYTEEINGGVNNAMVRVSSPSQNSVITSPVTVVGEARGNWYFEASLPVEVVGSDGTVLGVAPAQAQGEWMTTEFVPFSTTITFNPGKNTAGFIRVKKDNPSGDPSRDESIDIPVTFATTSGTVSLDACRPTGCSGQICSDEDIVSTCEYKPEYACYKTAKCERQTTGECGWTETPVLAACINNPPKTE
jgi:hypothetical protein